MWFDGARNYILYAYRRVNNIFPGQVTKMRWTTSWTICAADREKGTVGRIAGGYPGYQNGQ